MKKSIVCSLVALLSVASFGLGAAETEDKSRFDQTGWKTECVGRYMISLPGEIEEAVHSTKYLHGEESNVSFLDNTTNAYAGISFGGSIAVSSVVPIAEYQKFLTKFTTLKNDNSTSTVELKAQNNLYGFKRAWPTGASAWIYTSNRLYRFEMNGPSNPEIYNSSRDYFVANFIARSLYDRPLMNGVCFPYGFIKDDGKKERFIGVAMRLVEHPDVEIFFQDATAEVELKNLRPEFKGSRGQVERFWSRYVPSLGNILQGTLTKYHKVKLGGFDGVYAFATIVRPQPDSDIRTVGTGMLPGESMNHYHDRLKKEVAEGKHPLDYGYMAYFKGDPKAKEDTPDLMLYVIRTASRAVSAGKQPVSEEELKKMAEQIAASIKRKPVVAAQ